MERRGKRGPNLYPQTSSVKVEGLKPRETYWVDPSVLTQEHLDDITAIYCQVFRRSPEDLTKGLELEPLIRDIVQGFGFHEARIGGVLRTGIDTRRTILAQGQFIVRFGATAYGEAFQEAVDGYLTESAGIAKPLSQFILHK